MINFSPTSAARVWILTALGTLACIVAAMFIDGYVANSGRWDMGEDWTNNVLIPLAIAPPFFFFLLTKLKELSIAHEALMRIASRDPLTDCLNRRAFSALIEAYLERVDTDKDRPSSALLVLDVDHFKAVNDNFGHDEGDEALRLIATVIKQNVRELDLVGRLGGEEFGVFLPSADRGRAHAIAERIRAAVQSVPFSPSGNQHMLSLSVGGVTFNAPANYLQLYRFADQRLYSAKDAGRNRVSIAELAEAAVGRIERVSVRHPQSRSASESNGPWHGIPN